MLDEVVTIVVANNGVASCGWSLDKKMPAVLTQPAGLQRGKPGGRDLAEAKE